MRLCLFQPQHTWSIVMVSASVSFSRAVQMQSECLLGGSCVGTRDCGLKNAANIEEPQNEVTSIISAAEPFTRMCLSVVHPVVSRTRPFERAGRWEVLFFLSQKHTCTCNVRAWIMILCSSVLLSPKLEDRLKRTRTNGRHYAWCLLCLSRISCSVQEGPVYDSMPCVSRKAVPLCYKMSHTGCHVRTRGIENERGREGRRGTAEFMSRGLLCSGVLLFSKAGAERLLASWQVVCP